MANLSAQLKQRYLEYISEVPSAAANLTFLLENLGYLVPFDESRESLVALEKIYWDLSGKGVPSDISGLDHIADLMGQYLGVTIIATTGAKWQQ